MGNLNLTDKGNSIMEYTGGTPQESGNPYKEAAKYAKIKELENSSDQNSGAAKETFSAAARTGETPGKGNYSCTNCGTQITLTDGNRMPPCPRCGNVVFSSIN